MDNARIHHAVDVINFLEENQIRYMFLPRSSPELNPIELFFGTVKAAYRNGGPARTRAEMKRRIRDTFNAVDEGIDMTRYYSHMRQFVAKAANREHFSSQIDWFVHGLNSKQTRDSRMCETRIPSAIMVIP